MLHGEFILNKAGRELVIPNTCTVEGKARFLEMVLRADAIGGDGEFYMGLCGDISAVTTTLADIVGEPTFTAGYARNQLDRNSTDWPLLDYANNVPFMESKEVTFAASGGNFSTSVWRAFLCNQATLLTGTLFSLSAPFPAAVQLDDGESIIMKYRLYWR